MESFRDGDYTVLVATDVASRGLDIPDVKVGCYFTVSWVHSIIEQCRVCLSCDFISCLLSFSDRDVSHNLALSIKYRIQKPSVMRGRNLNILFRILHMLSTVGRD